MVSTATLPIISNYDTWIIHFEANRHITDSSKDFLIYFLCTQQKNVRLAYGSYILVSGTGSINCTPTIPLTSIPHVPIFSNSLLSISAFTRDFDNKSEFFLIILSFKIFKQERRLTLIDYMMTYMS